MKLLKPTFEIFPGENGEWYWHLLGLPPKKHMIAVSGEGHKSEQDCRDEIQLVREYAPIANVIVIQSE